MLRERHTTGGGDGSGDAGDEKTVSGTKLLKCGSMAMDKKMQ